MFKPDLVIKGGAFGKPTPLKGILSQRMNVTYGRNGSGKSTIARAFRERQPDRQATGAGTAFELSFDGSGTLPPEVCGHLFVFNEDFIEDNIKAAGGMKSIIRIGTSAELDGPIRAARERIKELKEQQDSIGEELSVLNGNSRGSIKEADTKVKDGLKKSGGYVSRLNRVEERDHNLVQSLLSPVVNHDSGDVLPVSIAEASENLNKSISRYLSFQSGTAVNWSVPDLNGLPDPDAVNDLLSRTVKPSALTAEERGILDELSQQLASENLIPKTESLLIKSPRGFCPLCHQSVSDHHKHILEERLVKFRDKSVQDLTDAVNLLRSGIRNVDVTLPSFPTADYDQDLSKAEDKLLAVNRFIDSIRSALEKKAANPYSGMEAIDRDGFGRLVKDCKDALDRVSEDVASFNRTFEEKDRLREEIDRDNIRLAYHENREWIATLNERRERSSALSGQWQGLEAKIREQNDLVMSLEARIDQVDDAREQINRYLDLIFGVRKIRLVSDGKEQYRLQIRKGENYEDIPTRSISSGERNALALAYFFACVLEKKDKNYNYGDPTLLVIDDPVSSFDADNKAGVISLIDNQIKKVLKGNPESKVLVLTHDYTTLRDLCLTLSNCMVPENIFGTPAGRSYIRQFSSLTPNHVLKSRGCKDILENMQYDSDLQDIFQFAALEDPDSYDGVDGIGNTIRRFTESYATRMYKCRWFDLFSNEEHLECIPVESRGKIRDFAMRSILNSESHGLSDNYTPAELQRSARTLLTYMFWADQRHLGAYLAGDGSKTQERLDMIRDWFA